MIRYIVTDDAGHILKSGHAPSEDAAVQQAGAEHGVYVLDRDPGRIDDRKVSLNLTTGALVPLPGVDGNDVAALADVTAVALPRASDPS